LIVGRSVKEGKNDMSKKLPLFFSGILLLAMIVTFSGLSSPVHAATVAPKREVSNTIPVPGGCPPTVSYGSRGNLIASLQDTLNRDGWRDQNGHRLIVDGIFGARTLFVVKNFQSIYAPPADGVVGLKTWTALGYCQPKTIQV